MTLPRPDLPMVLLSHHGPVQSDGRPVGTLDVHATSRGLVGRVAEARAQAAEQALQAGPNRGLGQRTAALDRAQDGPAARERAAGRNH